MFDEEDLVGFDDQSWHTHGDLLMPAYGATRAEARNAFFDAVLRDEEVICIFPDREPGHRVSITHDPDLERRVAGDEPLILRYWSGKILDRSVVA
jgi:hypothetical protein